MVGDSAKFAYLNLSTRVLKFKYVLNFKDVLRYPVGLDLVTSDFLAYVIREHHLGCHNANDQ